MRKIKFWKLSGAGNDFVLLTGGRPGAAGLRALAVKLCARGTAVGADGLLHVSKAARGEAAVRYFNSDGSEAFCGNGSRCAAWWAYSRGLVKSEKFFLRTAAGRLEARVTGREKVRLGMPDVAGAKLGLKGSWPAGVKEVHFLDTGVPHAVVPVEDLERTDVAGLGRALRHNKAFGPAGTNVDFVRVRAGTVRVRTYERGVEAETLACGTGVTAAAVALTLAGKVRPPVALEARSGDRFLVRLTPTESGARGVSLQGPAKIVFEGEIIC